MQYTGATTVVDLPRHPLEGASGFGQTVDFVSGQGSAEWRKPNGGLAEAKHHFNQTPFYVFENMETHFGEFYFQTVL